MSTKPRETRTSNRVIFLDFDGVILTGRTAAAYDLGWTKSLPDPVACYAIRRACDTGVKLVISSAHRSFNNCSDTLKRANLYDLLHRDWRTKELPGDRPFEIAEWLKRHRDVTDYAIIDDDPFRWTKEQRNKWIPTDPIEGMDSRALARLIEWSGAKRWRKPEPKKL